MKVILSISDEGYSMTCVVGTTFDIYVFTEANEPSVVNRLVRLDCSM
jgi:hypothetical protein